MSKDRALPEHDRSRVFNPLMAPPASNALPGQPDGGQGLGFDFSCDPLT
jgi:hypothetical protein